MGQKVNPKSFRLVYEKNWLSRWFEPKNQASFIAEDFQIRRFLERKLGSRSAIAVIEIERGLNKTQVTIHTGRPGVIIGRMGQGVSQLSKELEQKFGKKINLEILEIRKPELSAQLVALNMAGQIERRLPYKRVVKNAIRKVVEAGAKGVRVVVAGRLAGAEISRKEKYGAGTIPFSTIRAQVDYGFTEALTTYGVIGIKVYIYLGGAKHEKDEEVKPS